MVSVVNLLIMMAVSYNDSSTLSGTTIVVVCVNKIM